MPQRRAQLVLITGEPGSGKSTLADELSHSLRMPFFARDDVRGGLFFTVGSWSEQPANTDDGYRPEVESIIEFVIGATQAAVRPG